MSTNRIDRFRIFAGRNPRGRAVRSALAWMLLGGSALAQQIYLTATIDAGQETPPNSSTATGSACLVLDTAAHTLTYTIEFSGLSSAETLAHIHGFAAPGATAPPLFNLALGSPITGSETTTTTEEQSIIAGLAYVNIHTTNFPNGEIRGQVTVAPAPVPFCFGDGLVQTCPCGNNSGSTQDGCLNSLGVGAHLQTQGFASITCDSLELHAFQLPDSIALFRQGTTQVNQGFGTGFGDGLSCIGGSIVKLMVQPITSSATFYPQPGDPLISVQGSILAPGTRTYQVIYRNPVSFCTSDTFNLTNAVEVTWVP